MVEVDLVLQHETRRMIYSHIIAHPGVSFNVLKEVFGLASGTLRYHLDYLKRAEKISFDPERGRRNYYPHHSEAVVTRMKINNVQTFKLNSLQELIVNTLKNNSRINQKRLTKLIGVNRFVLRNNLNKLIDLGMVKKVIKGKNVYYKYISNGHMQYEILKTLVMKLLNGEIDEQTFLELKNKMN